MNINKELLTTRLSILMGRESLNFLTPTSIYKQKLQEYFNTSYTNKDIIDGLHEIEEAYIVEEHKKEIFSAEIEEDFV